MLMLLRGNSEMTSSEMDEGSDSEMEEYEIAARLRDKISELKS